MGAPARPPYRLDDRTDRRDLRRVGARGEERAVDGSGWGSHQVVVLGVDEQGQAQPRAGGQPREELVERDGRELGVA